MLNHLKLGELATLVTRPPHNVLNLTFIRDHDQQVVYLYLTAKKKEKKRKVKHGLKNKITQIIVDQNCDSFVETTRCWITFQFNKTKKKVILRGSLNVAAASSSSAASGVVSEQTHGPGLSGSERQWNRGYGPELELKGAEQPQNRRESP